MHGQARRVIDYLNSQLPEGRVLDIGAGNGFTAEKLTNDKRSVAALEPDERMIDLNKPLIWTKGFAQDIPFHSNSFQAAYATWAFFLEGVPDVDKGLRETERVVQPGGKLIIIDNYGKDEFSSYSSRDITSNASNWILRGFVYDVINTEFVFDSIEEARCLMTFYFGEAAKGIQTRNIEYNVAAFIKTIEK